MSLLPVYGLTARITSLSSLPISAGLARPSPRRQVYGVLGCHLCRSRLRWLAGFGWLVASLLAGTAAATAPPEYFLRIWQTEDGLPQNYVNAVVQTRDGYLWLGTFNGLVRFDGTRFAVFDPGNTPALASSRITSLFEDAQGRLWIGHETGDVTRWEGGQFFAVESSLPATGGGIAALGEDQSGKVWWLNARGVLVRGTDGAQFPPPGNVGVGDSPPAIVPGRAGGLWVVRAGSLSLIEAGQPLPVNLERPGHDYVQAACASRDGGLWVLVEERFRQRVRSAWTGVERASPCAQAQVTTVLETSTGALAVGTLAEGLFLLLADGTRLQFSRTNGLSHDWVRSLCEDREGNLWVGTGNGGLAALLPSRVTPINPPDQWHGKAVMAVCAARDGAVWAGTEGAGLYCLRGGIWTRFGEAEGLANLFVWSVAEDARGRLWVGTWGGGLFTLRDWRFERAPGLEDFAAAVLALRAGRGGELWLGTTTGLLRYDGGRTNAFGRAEGLHLPDVRVVLEDGGGAVWFGMVGGGLGRLQDGVVKQFRKADGMASDFVLSLATNADGALWIGTFGGGISRLKDGRFATVGTAQGLPNNVICALQDDGRGCFWVSSHGGIFRVAKADLDRCADGQLERVNCLVYGKGEGLPTLECSGGFQPASCATPDGRLWFPTRRGLVTINPEVSPTNPLRPPVIIEEVSVDGHPLGSLPSASTPLTIQPGQGRLEVRYTGLCFTAPEKVRFRHRLTGLETDWVEAGADRTVKYSYLLPGHYTFAVTACNNDGVWNESGATLELTVLPHFWQTWWFRALVGLAAAAAMIGAVLVVTRRRVRDKLERLERQRALERERSRIARDIHDDLGASLTRITMLSHPSPGEPEPPEQAAANLATIYETARELTRALDEIVWAVNPKHDTLDSLAAYLGKFAQDFLRPAGVRCRLEVPLQLPALPLTSETRHNLFLAFKEALNNAAKHSAATEATVSLTLRPDGFSLTVEDNGRSFHPEHPATGNGLANMRRRMEEIGGACEIRSTPGAGTQVKFTITTPTR